MWLHVKYGFQFLSNCQSGKSQTTLKKCPLMNLQSLNISVEGFPILSKVLLQGTCLHFRNGTLLPFPDAKMFRFSRKKIPRASCILPHQDSSGVLGCCVQPEQNPTVLKVKEMQNSFRLVGGYVEKNLGFSSDTCSATSSSMTLGKLTSQNVK